MHAMIDAAPGLKKPTLFLLPQNFQTRNSLVGVSIVSKATTKMSSDHGGGGGGGGYPQQNKSFSDRGGGGGVEPPTPNRARLTQRWIEIKSW